PSRAFLFSSLDSATSSIYPLSLHDALPICRHLFRPLGASFRIRRPRGTLRKPVSSSCRSPRPSHSRAPPGGSEASGSRRSERPRSEEHTSELQSRVDLVCRLLLEKKKAINS